MTHIEAARVLCRSHLARLSSIVDDPEKLRREKLDAHAGLSAAARFARLIDANEAGELLDDIADAMLDPAMRDPVGAAAHLDRLMGRVTA